MNGACCTVQAELDWFPLGTRGSVVGHIQKLSQAFGDAVYTLSQSLNAVVVRFDGFMFDFECRSEHYVLLVGL